MLHIMGRRKFIAVVSSGGQPLALHDIHSMRQNTVAINVALHYLTIVQLIFSNKYFRRGVENRRKISELSNNILP